jgi:hypothetical protein
MIRRWDEPSDDFTVYFSPICHYLGNFEICGAPAVAWYITRNSGDVVRNRSRCCAHGPDSEYFTASGFSGPQFLISPVMYNWDEVQVFDVLNT